MLVPMNSYPPPQSPPPPPPPSSPPGGTPGNPYGGGPYGGPPPQYGPYGGASYGPAKTSGAAITSLITGVLSIIPCLGILTIPIALITGVIGFFSAGKPHVKGRWMAVVGVLLALTLGLVINGAIVGTAVVGVQYASAVEEVGTDLKDAVEAMEAGDTAPLMRFVDGGSVDEVTVRRVVGEIKAIGPNVEVIDEGNQAPEPDAGELPNGDYYASFELLLRGDNGQRRLKVRLQGPGFWPGDVKNWKVSELDAVDAAGGTVPDVPAEVENENPLDGL